MAESVSRPDPPAAHRSAPCPICSKPATQEFRPFCSRRCADIDLHRWLSESYSVPVTEDPDEDGQLSSRSPSED